MPKRSYLNIVTDVLFEYETQKVVQINSKKIGAIFRLVQLGIIVYFVIWVMYFEKGYQAFDTAVSGVTAKLKGVTFSNITPLGSPSLAGPHVWDAADYIVPPQQNSAFFVTTNLVVTTNQSQGICPESDDVYGVKCDSDANCTSGKLIMLGNGVMTGRCVSSAYRPNKKVCEIFGWCPTENDILPIPKSYIMTAAPNFTVLLKNSIEFPLYNVKRRNILPGMGKPFLYTCRYDPKDDDQKYCPIFRLSDILKHAEATDPNIWIYGGMVSINIAWECNLDFALKHCRPEYSFRRLDEPKTPVGKGWNFRHAYHYVENGVQKRTLHKAYGIQFFITVYGKAGKFDLYTLTMNIGSGLGLLGVATVVCDMIILNLMRNKTVYRQAKVDLVNKSPSRRPSMDVTLAATTTPLDSPAVDKYNMNSY